MKNKFKVGDRVVLTTDLVIGKKYNGVPLLESLVSAFHNKEAIVERTSAPSNNEHWCKMVGNVFYYGVDMLEFVPNSFMDIINKKITCVVNVSFAKQAEILYDIFYGKFSTNVCLNFIQIFNKLAGMQSYENGVAFSFYKGKPQGYCYKEWYEQFENKYGKVYDFDDLYIEGEAKSMNKQERIKELKKQIEEINAQINELERDDTLEQYESDISWGSDRYTLDNFGCVKILEPTIGFNSDEYNPYRHYMTEEYANKASKIKKFNDMLMAFKWCYDRDYEPDWTTKCTKYCIVYNFDVNPKCYDVAWDYKRKHNEIYFSSEDVARKCANWLNNIDPNGELVI